MKPPIPADESEPQAALQRYQEDVERRVRERTAELAQANAALEREIRERRQADATLREIVEGVEADVGEQFFPSLARSLARAFGSAVRLRLRDQGRSQPGLTVRGANSPSRRRSLMSRWADDSSTRSSCATSMSAGEPNGRCVSST